MSRWFFISRKRGLYTPKDKKEYLIPMKVINDTENILKSYGEINPPNEGFVYWGGSRYGNLIIVSMVIAPKTRSDWGRVSTSCRSNFDLVKILNENNLVHIAQVHSHPSNWVSHSYGDDEFAAFKIDGLLSIVVPKYSLNGMLPLKICGIHIYETGEFIRLSQKYINTHFKIINKLDSLLVDFR